MVSVVRFRPWAPIFSSNYTSIALITKFSRCNFSVIARNHDNLTAPIFAGIVMHLISGGSSCRLKGHPSCLSDLLRVRLATQPQNALLNFHIDR